MTKQSKRYMQKIKEFFGTQIRCQFVFRCNLKKSKIIRKSRFGSTIIHQTDDRVYSVQPSLAWIVIVFNYSITMAPTKNGGNTSRRLPSNAGIKEKKDESKTVNVDNVKMETESTSSDPQRVDFLSTLSQPLQDIMYTTLSLGNTNLKNSNDEIEEVDTKILDPSIDAVKANSVSEKLNLSLRADQMEVQLREELLKRINDVMRDASNPLNESGIKFVSIESLCLFWRETVLVAHHILFFQKNPNITAKFNYDINAAQVRKLPIILLEDVVDVLGVSEAVAFWNNSMKQVSNILFGDLLWKDQNTAWLPFLKVGNKLWHRFTEASTYSSDAVSLAAADVMWTLATVYPLSEKSATRNWGGRNSDNETLVESELQFLDETVSDSTKLDGNTTTGSSSASDYNFYETFWKLQHDFRSPKGVVVAEFLKRIKSVIQSFESHPIDSTSPAPSATSISALCLPYLTQSRILHIQLKDPVLRVQILTQFCIVAHDLATQVKSFEPQFVALQPAISKLLTDATRSLNKPLDSDRTQESSFTPHYLKILNSILLYSETQWRHWKQNKCPPDSMLENRKDAKPYRSTQLKRKRKGESWNDDSMYQMIRQDELISASCKMNKIIPNYFNHLSEYVEALDPDAGIDDEYHPKRNSNFSWQALRLLSSDMLPDFGLVHPSGDFENFVRHVYKKNHNTDIPGEGPDVYEWNAEEDTDPVITETEDVMEHDLRGENEGGVGNESLQEAKVLDNDQEVNLELNRDKEVNESAVESEVIEPLSTRIIGVDEDAVAVPEKLKDAPIDEADENVNETMDVDDTQPSSGKQKSQENEAEDGETDELFEKIDDNHQPNREEEHEIDTEQDRNHANGRQIQPRPSPKRIEIDTRSVERESNYQAPRNNVVGNSLSNSQRNVQSSRSSVSENAANNWNRSANDYAVRERDVVEREHYPRHRSDSPVPAKTNSDQRSPERVYPHTSATATTRTRTIVGSFDARRNDTRDRSGRDQHELYTDRREREDVGRGDGRERTSRDYREFDDRRERDDVIDSELHPRERRADSLIDHTTGVRRVISTARIVDDRRATSTRRDDYQPREERRNVDRAADRSTSTNRRADNPNRRY